MSDLFGNHIVGFPTRRLISLQRLAAKVQELHDDFIEEYGNNSVDVNRLFDLKQDIYADSDIPQRLPRDLQFNP